MSTSPNDVVITGVGIVSCLGIGRDTHVAVLTGDTAPPVIVDAERFAPYPLHPSPDIDWSQQIPRRGDVRQMENWQRLGVFTAGLALDDAGFKDDPEACGSMHMIVAAGGGERDVSVDTMIVNEAAHRNDRGHLLNEKLTTELRPTLFLAQLSNLLAGNISIVHKVTGSSQTFMGEEGAGVSAVATAFERIRSGQATHALVGGAFNAERSDMLLLFESFQNLQRDTWQPLWSRLAPGGIVPGSASAFLVLESRRHAEERGARIYAVISSVHGDRGRREDGQLETRLMELAKSTGSLGSDDLLILSGSSGQADLAARERSFIEHTWPGSAFRGYAGIMGHTVEAHFPLGLALAALSLETGAQPPKFDPEREPEMTTPSTRALVTAIGFRFAEGMALLKSESDASKGDKA